MSEDQGDLFGGRRTVQGIIASAGRKHNDRPPVGLQVRTDAQDLAKAAADLGIERSAARAEKCDPGWVDRAAEYIRADAAWAEEGALLTIEQLRGGASFFIGAPPDGRAWGAVTRRAIKLGYIEKVPGAFAPANSSNGSPKPLYRKGPNA
jgi:hypothetical protein